MPERFHYPLPEVFFLLGVHARMHALTMTSGQSVQPVAQADEMRLGRRTLGLCDPAPLVTLGAEGFVPETMSVCVCSC